MAFMYQSMGRTFHEHILHLFHYGGWIAEMLFMVLFAYIAV